MKRLGPEAKVRINGTSFAAVSGEWEAAADTPDASDTESAPFKEVKDGGLRQLTANVEAHYDDAVNVHATPLLIEEGTYILFELFPEGLSGPVYIAPDFLVASVGGAFRVPGSEVQIVRFRGMSTGAYEKRFL